MSNWCSYEWDIEEYDRDADDPEAEIVDHHFGDKVAHVGFTTDNKHKLVLVRDSEQGKLWAYADDKSRMLPRYFSRPEADGKYYETNVEVPQRFHREIAAYACRKV